MWETEEPPYRLGIEERSGFLYASLRGDRNSFELSMTAVTDLAAICRARGIRKLLVEHDLPSCLTTFEVYTLAEQIPKLYRGIVVAFVIHQSTTPGLPEFLEIVARNRGAKGQLFADARAAEEWLLSR
jgi:hypothetical protein